MSNEIVKFSNQFNNQALRRFTALDLDMLMAISTKVRDKGTEEVSFTFDELKRLTRLRKNLTVEQMAQEVIQVNERLLALNFRFEDGSKTIQFALFSCFETDHENAMLTVAVNQRFAFLLNELTSGFTRFELAEFADLKSSYAKEFYRRAKQYRSTGVWAVSLDEFRRLLDVPTSYKTGDITKFVLKPIEKELDEPMHLRIERKYRKKGHGSGRTSLVGFVFHFDREAPQTRDAITVRQPPRFDNSQASRMSEQDRAALEAERARHGGSMFIGSDGYRPAEDYRWLAGK